MKNLLTLSIVIISIFSLEGQTDISFNPLGTAFGNPKLGADIALSDRVSIEPIVGFRLSDREYLGDAGTYSTMAFLKLYTSKAKIAKGFFVGPWMKFVSRKFDSNLEINEDPRENRLGLGLGFGYKAVYRNNIVFSFDCGSGWANKDKVITDQGDENLDVSIPIMTHGRLSIGYRF